MRAVFPLQDTKKPADRNLPPPVQKRSVVLELVFIGIYSRLFGKFCCILRKKYLPGDSPPAYFFLVCNKIMLENPHIFLVKTGSNFKTNRQTVFPTVCRFLLSGDTAQSR